MFLPILAFLFGTALVGGAAMLLMPRRQARIDQRLEELMAPRDAEEQKPRMQSLIIALPKRAASFGAKSRTR